nr:hypothetical protein [Xenococcaceae cyanobacterium MO_188.B19]
RLRIWRSHFTVLAIALVKTLEFCDRKTPIETILLSILQTDVRKVGYKRHQCTTDALSFRTLLMLPDCAFL